MHLFSLLARLRRAFVAPLPLVGLLAAVGPLVLSAGSVDTAAQRAEVAYLSLPELPVGSAEQDRAGVEQSAIALAVSLGAVPIDALGAACPSGDLAVSWEEPDPGFEAGAHVTPIGPAPTATTTSVNGIVVCTGFDYGYMGFEAQWAGSRWDVVAVPFVGEGEEDHLVPQPAQAIPQGPKPVPVLAAPGTVTGPIEGYAAYEPQRTCDASAKVGTKSLAGALLRDYPVSRNLGIVRGCGVGGRSEHKEGRAFDWGVNITNPNEKAAADAFIGALLATDADGNANALARRMGVMYVIYNRQIWSSYRLSEGWRPYSGASAHRDHIHISMSWGGALGRTSFWSGTVPLDLPVASPNTSTVASSRGTASNRARNPGDTTASSGRSHGDRGDRGHNDDESSSTHLSRDELNAGVQALWHDGQPPSEDEIRAWLVSVGVSDDDASRYASRAAERLARQAPRADDDEDEANDEADHDADDEADEERQARHEAEREARHQAEEERQARHEAEREARHQAEAEREARQQAEREARHQAEREARHQAEAAREARHQAERERRAAEEAARQAEREQRGGGRHGDGGGRGRGHGTTTTLPPTTTTTVPTTTTTVPPSTTTTVAPETTTTTAVPETTTTTI